MNRNDITTKLTTVFREVFNNASLNLNDGMSAKDIDNWDSLTHMLMITRVEEVFGIKFRLRELNRLKCVGDIISLLVEKTE